LSAVLAELDPDIEADDLDRRPAPFVQPSYVRTLVMREPLLSRVTASTFAFASASIPTAPAGPSVLAMKRSI